MKKLKKLLDGPAEDRGAALVLVLVIVWVMGAAGLALLDFSYTSIRTTFALRDQAAAAYAADGAGKVAVAKLAGATYLNNCATVTGDPLSLGDSTTAFYTGPTGTTALNAYVTCSPDTNTSNGVMVSAANKPDNAIVTVGDDTTLATPLPGQLYSGKPVTIGNGNVRSNSSINASGTLSVTGTGATIRAALAAPNGCLGKFAPACLPGAEILPTPPLTVTTPPVSLAPAPVCPSTYAAFRPGLYDQTSLTKYLNGTCGKKAVVWFSPGTYYFDFTGVWTAPARIIAGTPTDADDKPITGLDPAVGSTLSNLSQLNPASSGACANPSEQVAPGAIFVFGGTSTIKLGAKLFEICATYSATSVPIAIYGPTAAIPVNGGTASAPVSAQTVCQADDCVLFGAPNASGKADFHIQGFTYAPNARIKLTLKNSNGQVFNWGLVLRSFSIATNGASPTGSVVQLPSNSTGGTTTYSIMYLSVWVCPQSGAACDHSPGSQQLTAKVQVTGTPATATVLSWSVQR
jgi:Tfp pilus assembly protein PilX